MTVHPIINSDSTVIRCQANLLFLHRLDEMCHFKILSAPSGTRAVYSSQVSLSDSSEQSPSFGNSGFISSFLGRREKLQCHFTYLEQQSRLFYFLFFCSVVNFILSIICRGVICLSVAAKRNGDTLCPLRL